MQPNGVFTSTISQDEHLESYMLTYQAFPWLEATYRYNGFKKLENQNWDRNYEVKLRLLEETDVLPQVSVGIRDLVGTGVFGAEYIVANKQHKQWDVTLGVGWGNLAGNGMFDNPLSAISDRFDNRTRSGAQGGTLQTDSFFSGSEVSLFGGVSYQFEDYPITALVEYNPNPFLTGQTSYDNTPARDPWSVGLTWQATHDFSVSLAYRHMQTLGLNFQGRLNTKAPPRKGPRPDFISSLDMAATELPKGINKSLWYDRLLYDLERAELFIHSARIIVEEHRAEIEIGQFMYPYWPDAIDQAHVFASYHLPDNVFTVDYIINVDGHNPQVVRLPRFQRGQTPITVADTATVLPPRTIIEPQHKTNFFNQHVHVDLTLSNRLMLFDPDQPFSIQFYLKAATNVNLPYDLKLHAAYRYNIWHNFDELNRVSDSVLPKVRTNVLQYMQQGEDGVEALYLEKRGTFDVVPELHYRVYAGVLELMYSGIGSEVLYQPNQSRLAFGLSAAYVQQREFDGGLGHRDYKTAVGYASLYWATPFEHYDVAIHAGKYLAKDYGATVEVRRTFDNGWQLGLWATKTNVSAEDFGEGSFDKGMFIRVPLHSLTGSNVRSVYQSRIRPIQRDGGARMEDFNGTLWWDLQDVRYSTFAHPKLVF